MPSKKHKCSLRLKSESEEWLNPMGNGVWNRLCRSLRSPCQISEHHPETYDWFYSYPEVLAERKRHLYEGGCYLIHPYSIMCLSWNTFMIVVNLAHMWLSPFRLCFILTPIEELKPHYLDLVMLMLNIICWIDILVKLNTGYVEMKRVHISMSRKLICCHYMRTWFFLDLISNLPISLCLLYWYPVNHRWVLWSLLLPWLRFARIYTVFMDLKPFVKTFVKSYICHGTVRHIVLFLITCHWCSCILYLPTILQLYWYGTIPPKYAMFLRTESFYYMLNYSVYERYRKSTIITLASFLGTGYAVFKTKQHDEFVMHTFVTTFTSMFMIYNFVFLLKIYMTVYSTTISYHELSNQVEEYMRHKQFPLRLKNRVREFYHRRYEGKYFNETNALLSLSEGLRNEITFHTCHKLMEKVSLFRGVAPDVIGSILGSLNAEVFLPNESVMRAGEIGHCMYFVASGTVAVYSLKGAEVCHLEDGAHFGEVALLMKDTKRVATVIAVETTELYRLDQAEFKQFIMTNEILFERVEALASQRMHETVIVDGEYRSERSRSSD